MYNNLIGANAVVELFERFSLSSILIILFLAFFLALETIKGICYIKDLIKNRHKEVFKQEDALKNIEDISKQNLLKIELIGGDVSELKERVNVLQESDRDQIRAWILEKDREYSKLGYIPSQVEYDVLIKVYNNYQKEGGNGTITEIMKKLKNMEVHYNK